MSSADLASRLAAYAATRMPAAREVEVRDLSRISGGASRQTYRFRLAWTEGCERRERRLILRRDPPASLIDTERRVEFAAYSAFHGTKVPVPEMIWLEEGSEALDQPFSVAEEITGFEAAPALLWTEPYLASHEALARTKWTILGEIARADPFALGLDAVMPPPEPATCAFRELDMWEKVLDEDQAEPLPITRAAIRWLRANPPPAAQKIGVVHGDFRTGNFLYDRQGGIHGVLDWEMAHLGDPLEDLGWSLNPVWNFKRNLAGGLVPDAVAIAHWETASGLRADPAAVRWWTLFNCVKGQAIWISSARAWIDGGNREPIMVLPAWGMQNAQDRAILKVMDRL